MTRDAAQDWARQAHAPQDAARDRTDDLNVFGRNVRGAAEPAAPLNRGRSSGGGEPASVVILPGHHLALEASAGHPLDGTAISFDTIVRDDGWDATLGAGKSTFTFPSTACFDFGDLEIEFDEAAEWAGTVTVTVKVNGEARWEATGYGNDNGISWSSGMLGAVVEGDTWSLHVDAPDAPSPTSVRVKMQRVERQAPDVDEPPPKDVQGTTSGSDGAVGNSSVTLAAPSGTEVGDLMIATSAHSNVAGSVSGTTVPAGWTVVADQDAGSNGRTVVATRVATQDDVDGINDWTWGTSGSGTRLGVAIVSWDLRGESLVDPNVETDTVSGSTSLSAQVPGSGWGLVVAVGRRSSNDNVGTVAFVDPAVRLAHIAPTGGVAEGRHAHGTSPAGTEPQVDFSSVWRFQLLAVFGVE